MQRRDINAASGPPPAGQYTQAVEVSHALRTLYVSGQVGTEPDGTMPEDATAQARLAWRNLHAQLEAAGMTLDNVVKITTIIPDAGDIPASRVARAEALGDRRPASTLIVGGLANPGWKIEIEAVAVA